MSLERSRHVPRRPEVPVTERGTTCRRHDRRQEVIGAKTSSIVHVSCQRNHSTKYGGAALCRHRQIRMGTGNYSAISNIIKLIHWPLMRGLLHLVQRGGDWAEPQPAQAPPRRLAVPNVTAYLSMPVHRCSAVLMCPFKG